MCNFTQNKIFKIVNNKMCNLSLNKFRFKFYKKSLTKDLKLVTQTSNEGCYILE